ncbi:MAG: rhodanese-like domain-containing protein [Dechloromonas sp.]|nr:rhodanese-like domain-containing protein [Dechloromonas sp.]
MEFINQNILLVSIVVVSALGLLWPMFFRSAGLRASPAEATALINREEAKVLDVREPDEFASGHLPDAINIPVGKLGERMHELERFKERPLIVCCASGMRSNRGCAELKKAGFAKLYNLEGGMDAWLSANYPVHKGGRKK